MNRPLQVLAAAFILSPAASLMAQAPAPSEYKLVWSDEFDVDGAPDPKNWIYERGFVRNNERQWYQPENARVEGGMLCITARSEKKMNPEYDLKSANWKKSREYAEYTSSSIKTRGLHEWTFGRFEMRARIDTRAGLWPAFWTMGSERGWPASGEIDIMEYYRGVLLANVFWGHVDAAARGNSKRKPIAEMGGPEWSQKFHVWRMDWDFRKIDIFVDDLLLNSIDLETTYNEENDDKPKAERINPLREPQHIILNLAVGGDAGGDPAATEFPARLEVDWVRVYQKPDQIGTQTK